MISEPLPWLELNLLESGWCFLVILTAAVIRGYSGFGFSALTVAGLTLILPPAEVIPIAFFFGNRSKHPHASFGLERHRLETVTLAYQGNADRDTYWCLPSKHPS